jgi:RNA polymerase sigma-54 factor
MAIKLLQLNQVELVDKITQELAENPALEEGLESVGDEKTLEQTEAKTADSATKEVTIDEKISDNIDWNNYLDEYSSFGRTRFETEQKDAPQYEAFIARKDNLNDHLLWQLLMSSLSEKEKHIGSIIIGSINKDGYLEVSVDEIADMSDCPVEDVEDVLFLLHTFDPPGVCARDLSECLLIQAKALGFDDPTLIKIIKNHIKNLENKNYKAICRDLRISIKEVIFFIDIIKKLEPKPGREFLDEEPRYITPDIYVYKVEDEFVIMLNDNGMPRLHISPYYREVIKQGKDISGQTKGYLQEKIRSASWLIRSIYQRQKTIYKVMESIMKFQYEFFEKGITYLKPMVLRDVAQDIGMHESTVSRVTSNKYAHTPQGIFELKYFFNSSIRRSYGGEMASVSVQYEIRKIIESENPKKPYSDDKIANLLNAEDINIARRTIAKYRDILGILSSSKRKTF